MAEWIGMKILRFTMGLPHTVITICSIVERKVGVYKEIVEGDNNL